MSIEVCIGNYGYYNEGELRDRWITLPKTNEEIQKFLSENGLQDPLHEEIYISDYDGIPFDMPYGTVFSEYTSLDNLNLLAKQLELNPQAEEIVTNALDTGIDAPSTMSELLNLVEQADDIPFQPWPDELNYSSPEERLAYAEIDEIGGVENLNEETLREHFNYESYGRLLDHEGFYIGDSGYLDDSIGDVDTEYYSEEELIDEALSKGFDEDHAPSREEMIADFESVGFGYLENFNNYNLRTWQAVHYLIDDLTYEQDCALELYSDHMSAIPSPIEIGNAALQVDDIAYHEWPDNGIYSNDHERLAYAEIEVLGGLRNLSRETLENHFDYESYGQELEQSFYLGDEGYLLATADMPDLEYYSLDELRESINSNWLEKHPELAKTQSLPTHKSKFDRTSVESLAASATQIAKERNGARVKTDAPDYKRRLSLQLDGWMV